MLIRDEWHKEEQKQSYFLKR